MWCIAGTCNQEGLTSKLLKYVNNSGTNVRPNFFHAPARSHLHSCAILHPPDVALQVTQILKPLNQANGTTVTFTLDPKFGDCNTAEKFFYGGSMNYIVQSYSNRCCGAATITARE